MYVLDISGFKNGLLGQQRKKLRYCNIFIDLTFTFLVDNIDLTPYQFFGNFEPFYYKDK